MPINNTDNDLLELLSNQGVKKVKRFHSDPEGEKYPMTTVALFFSSKILPREVIVAHEIFRVKTFIPRPVKLFHREFLLELISRVGTIVPILDENVIVNSFLRFPDYRPIHFEMVIDR